MKVKKVEIKELINDNDYKTQHVFTGNLELIYDNNRNKATLKQDGVQVAELRTYDDYPVSIVESGILITGIAVTPAPETKEGFADWEITT
jgi:hypothetical protein